MPHGLSGKIDGIFAVQARRFHLICDAVVPFLMQISRQLIVQDAKLWLDTGTLFGQGGEGFERINIACPRTTIEQAMQRLEHAVHKTR